MSLRVVVDSSLLLLGCGCYAIKDFQSSLKIRLSLLSQDLHSGCPFRLPQRLIWRLDTVMSRKLLD